MLGVCISVAALLLLTFFNLKEVTANKNSN